MNDLASSYTYTWPRSRPAADARWSRRARVLERALSESADDLHEDSQWPAFFPSTICLVTTSDGKRTALEKVVGASIVNRFPYVLALSFCTRDLSSRHYARKGFLDVLEAGQSVALQFVEPGAELDAVMGSIRDVPDSSTGDRIARSGMQTRRAETSGCPVFSASYLVYEGRLVRPGRDLEDKPIFARPYTEYGSHRIYYFEIQAIQLRTDIAAGRTKIHWRPLPEWPLPEDGSVASSRPAFNAAYTKGYTADYRFPTAQTVAFTPDTVRHGMAIKRLDLASGIEIDNDNARWPCFFPSSAGMITTWDKHGTPNLMPCGSTTVLIRSPLCIGICVSYAKINVRYAPRATLRALDETGRFACGVPFNNDRIVDAIRYAGNVSIDADPEKIVNAGLPFEQNEWAPIIRCLPITFMCEVVATERLGTHMLYLGEVKTICLRDDVDTNNQLSWCPFPFLEQE